MFQIDEIRNNPGLLPTTPGVYLFLDENLKAIYIGKANNLKNRLRSYFLEKGLGEKTGQMLAHAKSVDLIRVESEFEALLLESRLIGKYKPKYNIAARDDKSPLYIIITNEAFPRVRTGRKTELGKFPKNSKVFGPFPSSSTARNMLKRLRRIFPFCESKGDKGRPCLHSHIGLCDPCPRYLTKYPDPGKRTEYLRNLNNLKRVLSGKTKFVTKILETSMMEASGKVDFESAAKIRNQINELNWLTEPMRSTEEYLTNPNLIEDEEQAALDSLKVKLNLKGKPYRIECYDISHTGKSEAAASMVVAINGQINKSEYKNFKIKFTQTPNDVGAIGETISRRLTHYDWGIPDLIVIDGGKPQLSAAMSAIADRNSDIKPAVIGLAKRQEEIFIPGRDRALLISMEDPGLKLLMKLRDEAHRFARRLHHKLRTKALFR